MAFLDVANEVFDKQLKTLWHWLRRLALKSRVVDITPIDISGALTRNSAWQTYDATADTSDIAKWIILSIFWDGTLVQSLQLELRKLGRAGWDSRCYYLEVGSGARNMSWQVKVAMDTQQRFQYRSTPQGGLTMKVVGYIE